MMAAPECMERPAPYADISRYSPLMLDAGKGDQAPPMKVLPTGDHRHGMPDRRAPIHVSGGSASDDSVRSSCGS